MTTSLRQTAINNREPLFLAVLGTVSFVGGLLVASYGMRLRDRERLRRACSRVQKQIESTQRTALGHISKILLSKSSSSKEKVLVIGAGSYGTAMAYTCACNGHDVVLYMRDADQCSSINSDEHINSKYLSQYPLNPNGNAIRGICTEDELKNQFNIPGIVVILALPCQRIPNWIKARRNFIPDDVLLVSTAKGLYLPTQQLVGHAILDALQRASQPICFLSGPSFAEEIVKGYPTFVVVASDRLYLATKIQRLMSNGKHFRVYTSNDPIGVQLGGALKNPLAVGAGMIAGLGFGSNTLSAMVTRASRELCDLVVAMGAQRDNCKFHTSSLLTDHLYTLFLFEIYIFYYIINRVPTADVAVMYADMCGLECPIFRTVQKLIHNQIKPDEAFSHLMSLSLRQESAR